MNVFPKFLVVFFLLILGKGIAQEDSLRGASLFIAPLPLIDGYNGSSYRIGSEISLGSKYSTSLELGGWLPKKDRFNQKGFSIKNEWKYFPKSTFQGNYFSLELYYKQHAYQEPNTVYFSNLDFYDVVEKMDIKVAASSIKYGRIIRYGNYIYLDGYVGLGVRYKDIRTNLRSDEHNHLSYGDPEADNILYGSINKDGKYYRLNLALGFKLGILFWAR